MAAALILRNGFVVEHRTVLAVSVGAHLAVAVLLALNLDFLSEREAQPVRLAIQAQVVDPARVAQRAKASEAERREALRADIRRRQEELRAAERERQERTDQAAAERAESERRRVAERRRAEAERQRTADERRAAEAKAKASAAEKQRAAAEARKKAEADRRAAQSRAELARQMAEEEELLAAADSGLLDQYAEVIRQKVERNWIRPPSAREGINCVVLVRQIPGGEVVEVRVTDCNGDAAVVRSIEAAVLRSSPLPPPPDRSLFERSLRFNFRPRD